jgi:invasion protein IalB
MIYRYVFIPPANSANRRCPTVTLSPFLATRHPERPLACRRHHGEREEQYDMTYRIASAPARPAVRTLATLTAASLMALVASTPGSAQQQPAQPGAKPAAPARPAQGQKPAAPAAQQPAQPQAQAPQGEQPQLIFSPWTKFCLKGQEANAKQVCFTGKDARLESGMPVVAAVLIEPEGDPKKVLRVTLPLGMQIVHGTRIIVDQGQPAQGPYVICFTNGCMADYEVSADLIGRLKKGQQLSVQAINSNGQPISLNLPLSDFAKAYDGPPTDPKVFEEQQKKLQDQLQARAQKAREELQKQQPAAPGAKPQ